MVKISLIFSYLRKMIHNTIAKGYEFEPLDIRHDKTLSSKDYYYALKMQSKYDWLIQYSNKFETTISSILTDDSRKELFSRALKKFIYIDRNKSHDNILSIVNQIENIWTCNKNDTAIVAVRKTTNKHPDGSDNLLYNLQDELKQWKSSRFINEFDLDIKCVINSRNLILCDDFIGSGGTIENRIKEIKTKFGETKNIYVVSLGAMQISRKLLDGYRSVNVFTPVWVKCGLDHTADSRDRSLMLEMEKQLSPKYKEYTLKTMSLGYKESGGLYFNEEFRIPNNVYPIFWWGKLVDGTNFDSIFLRS